MIYQFKDVETGEPVDINMPMAKAVDIGAIITRRGRKLKRLPPKLQEPTVEGDRFINYQVAVGTDQASGADYYDKKGRPMFKSKRRAANWAANKTGEGIIAMEID